MPLYERETEITALSALLVAAKSGTGGLAVLDGPAGIGKSGLLAEARAMAVSRGMTVLAARGLDLERDSSFGIAADLFAGLLARESALPGGPAPPRSPGSQAETQAGTDAVAASRLFSGQAALAGGLFDPSASAPADPSALIRGLYWLTVNVAAATTEGDRPAGLLIEVDDAQWADRPSLSYLAHLAARIDELPVALIVAVRSGESATDQQTLDWLRDESGRRLLRPGPLSPEAIDRMARVELPGAEPAFTRVCAEVSGGNPFLATELLRALSADGITPVAASASQVRALVPDSVLRVILVRLARLGEPAERLAKAVAVLGDRVPLRQARLLAGLDAEQAEQAADALASAHIMAPGEGLSFAHPLIATSVYGDIAVFARSRAHRRAADMLAADGTHAGGVAAHLVLTQPDGNQSTVTILREAAARTRSKGDPGAAAHLLSRALAEPPDASRRADVLLELADAEIEHGDHGALRHIEEALGLHQTNDHRVRALTALSRLRFNRGEHEAAARATEQALELLKPADPALPPLLGGYLTATMFRAGLHPFAEKRLRPLTEAARAGHPPADPGLLAHLTLRLAFAAEPADRIVALAERAIVADPLVDPASLGILNGLIVQALCCVDELGAAEYISDRALAAARRRGSLLSFSMASYHRAIGRYHRGELASALADVEQSFVARREGWTAGDAWSGSLLAHIHLERGDLAASRDALRMTADAAPDSMDLPVARFAHARLALAEGRPDAALRAAETAGHLLSTGFGIDHPGFLPWRRTAVLAAQTLGEGDRARQLADELLERARWSGTARAIGIALLTQATVTHGERRTTLLAEAADALAGSPSALERAHALVDLGTACRQEGSRAAAAPPLREGLQLADRMGAAPLVQAARRELRALGLRPRRSAVTGPDSLTPTERRVAELAASGLTNRQTAEALFVTVKTVETHLARVYQKLCITTRAELANHVTG